MPPKKAKKVVLPRKASKSAVKSKSTAKKLPPPPAPGSEEEVVMLIKEQLQVHKVVDSPPGSDGPSASILNVYKQGVQKLRKSINSYMEYQSMYEQAAKSELTTADKFGDAQEQGVRNLVTSLEQLMQDQKPMPEDVAPERLRKEQIESLEEELAALEDSFLKPFRGFLTTRPQWVPEDRMILDGCDKEFKALEIEALDIDESDLAPMPRIPDSKFYSGEIGNFSRLQDEAADKRYAEYSYRKKLQSERDQLKRELDEKDREIEEIDGLEIKEQITRDEEVVDKCADDVVGNDGGLSPIPSNVSNHDLES